MYPTRDGVTCAIYCREERSEPIAENIAIASIFYISAEAELELGSVEWRLLELRCSAERDDRAVTLRNAGRKCLLKVLRPLR